MALPYTIDPTTPAGSDSPAQGDDQFRALKQGLVDTLGWPLTAITQTHPTTVGFEVDGGSTEATTTSLTAADVKSVTTSITVDEGALVIASFRKSAGAANNVSLGLKINSTVIFAPQSVTGSENEAQQGFVAFIIGPRSTSYLLPFVGYYASSGATGAASATWGPAAAAASFPNATITAIVIRGLVGDAAITLGVNNVMVFKLPKGS